MKTRDLKEGMWVHDRNGYLGVVLRDRTIWSPGHTINEPAMYAYNGTDWVAIEFDPAPPEAIVPPPMTWAFIM